SLPGQAHSGYPARVTLVIPSLGPFELYFSGPSVLVLVEVARQPALPSEGALQQAFALSPAEARLALAIANGATVSAAAASLRIAAGTARVQLKSVFAKMEVHRQADLVAKIYRSARSLSE